MDRELMIKDVASLLGTTEDTIINWELRDVKPTLKRHRKGLVEFLGPEVYDGRIPIVWPLGSAGNSKSAATQVEN